MSLFSGLLSQARLKGEENQLHFILEGMISEKAMVVPVRVIEADTQARRLTVQPIIDQATKGGQAIPRAIMHDIPYGYEQAGECVLQIDPQPGDIGIAVCSYRDISRLKATQQASTPATMRCYAWEDAMYIRTLWTAKTPKHVIAISPTGGISLTSPQPVTVNADLQVNGTITATGDVKGGGISLDQHTHSGVQTGGANTGKPQ